MKNLVYLLLVGALFAGCNAEDGCSTTINLSGVDNEQLAKDIEAIDAYLDDKGIVAIEDQSGLRYVYEEKGTGEIPDMCGGVSAIYSGTVMNGAFFDGTAQPRSFGLSQVILGWQVAFSQIPGGSRVTLYIPSQLAYGKNGSGSVIKPNDNLIFVVEVVATF